MKSDKTHARISQQRAFGPTLEWESLPVLGARQSRLAMLAGALPLLRRLVRR